MSARREIDKAINHILEWAERPEWADEKIEIYDRTILAVAGRMEMEASELLQILHEAGLLETLFRFCFEDLSTYRFTSDDRNLTEDFLKRRGWREGVHGRRYLRQLGESVLSLYEVQAVEPGNYCDVLDLVRGGKPVRVFEKSGTSNMARWDRIGARILPGSGKHMFSGAILPFTPDSSEALLRILGNTQNMAREVISGRDASAELTVELQGALESDFLKYAAPAFSQTWLTDVVERLERPLPELFNRDGESLVFAETQFKFDKKHRKDIIALLDGADGWERHNKDDPNWAWLPKGKTGSQTIHGFLEARASNLWLSTNSNSRYEKGSAVLKELLGDLIGPPLTRLQSPEQMLEERALSGKGSAPSPPPPGVDAQELAQVMSGYLDQHYREALDEQIPALGGKAPRQCVKTRQGKEKVIAWLKSLENTESHKANRDGSTAYDFTWMWVELGLEKPAG